MPLNITTSRPKTPPIFPHEMGPGTLFYTALDQQLFLRTKTGALSLNCRNGKPAFVHQDFFTGCPLKTEQSMIADDVKVTVWGLTHKLNDSTSREEILKDVVPGDLFSIYSDSDTRSVHMRTRNGFVCLKGQPHATFGTYCFTEVLQDDILLKVYVTSDVGTIVLNG